MRRDDVVLQAKITPPRAARRVLSRPRIASELGESVDYRLTVVQAGPGYGKTTALAALASEVSPLAWCTLDAADASPQRFLSYLIAAFGALVKDLPTASLAALRDMPAEEAPRVVDMLTNALKERVAQPTLLVLDDYQEVAQSVEIAQLFERFVTYAPDDVHVVVATRDPIQLPALSAWCAKGRARVIGRDVLAFRRDETAHLFRDAFGLALGDADIDALHAKTEGWPIALHLVWQGMRAGNASVAEFLQRTPNSLGSLFDYLARDVMARQPDDLRRFARQVAVLRELTPAACDAVTGRADGTAMLEQLHRQDLFVVTLGAGHYRFHRLFHDFLRAQLADSGEDTPALHARAAEHLERCADDEGAIEHWLLAGASGRAADAIEREGDAALRAGRLDTLAHWIDALPVDLLAARPLLRIYLGDVYRLRSRFDEALAWYGDAERQFRSWGEAKGISRALRGKALIYLDTVRPREAEGLLIEALGIIDGSADRDARSRLLELLAENKLNMGKPSEAQMLRDEARALRAAGYGQDALSVRVMLRTGRLSEAASVLESWMAEEQHAADLGHTHEPRAHRETALLLSLVSAFRGETARAFELAQSSIMLGDRLGSPFVTAVANIRLGHAWQLRDDVAPQMAREQSIRHLQAAVALGDRLAVRRTRAEAMWGLTRAFGFAPEPDLAAAQAAATEGAEIARWAGDPWLGALIDLTLGASLIIARRMEPGLARLGEAVLAFRDCADTHGRAACRLWQAVAHHRLGQWDRFGDSIEEALRLCDAHEYDFLFTRRALLGAPEPRALIRLLIEARDRGFGASIARRLLVDLGLPNVHTHPGYQLRVHVLGEFQVWRGTQPCEPSAWRRDKARQLFQYLVAQSGRPVQREEITGALWPDLTAEAAARDFKVALNALNHAVEPEHQEGAPFAFVQRDGSAYFLARNADIWVDSREFQQRAEAGLRRAAGAHPREAVDDLTRACELYQGDFLAGSLYDDWTSDERERLQALFMRAADRLADLHLEDASFERVIALAERLLGLDPCWENAYRLLMTAYARQGNRTQALRAYQHCEESLRAELGIAPSAATRRLREAIAAGVPV